MKPALSKLTPPLNSASSLVGSYWPSADLLRRVRQEHAQSYLRAGRSDGEIAELLGYAETRSFVRAFGRWTGQTPAGYRRAFRSALAAMG